MTEIVSAAISAGVALIVALFAHARAVRIQRSEKKAKEEAAGNEQVRVITEAYENLVNTLKDDAQRNSDQLIFERGVWEEKERKLLDKIERLESELALERQERIQLQARLERLEKRLGNLHIE